MTRAGPTASTVLDRVLVLEMVRVTEAAAIAASKLIGRGDEKAADQAAVEAMRAALNELPMDGTVVIGDGERDEAPILFIASASAARRAAARGSHRARPARVHDHHAKGGPNALAVLAIAEQGCLLTRRRLHGQIGDRAVMPRERSTWRNRVRQRPLGRRRKGVDPSEIIVCVLDRPPTPSSSPSCAGWLRRQADPPTGTVP